MASKPNGKPVMRRIELTETDWHWLSGWISQLLKTMSLDDMSDDTLRMGNILHQLEHAPRVEDISE